MIGPEISGRDGRTFDQAQSDIDWNNGYPHELAENMRLLDDVEITDPNVSGVIFAHGSRFGGHSLFIKDKKLHYVYNFPGISPEQEAAECG